MTIGIEVRFYIGTTIERAAEEMCWVQHVLSTPHWDPRKPGYVVPPDRAEIIVQGTFNGVFITAGPGDTPAQVVVMYHDGLRRQAGSVLPLKPREG